jgi:hypothetical protein
MDDDREIDALLLRFLFSDYIIPVIEVLLPAWLLHHLVLFLLEHYRVYRKEGSKTSQYPTQLSKAFAKVIDQPAVLDDGSVSVEASPLLTARSLPHVLHDASGYIVKDTSSPDSSVLAGPVISKKQLRHQLRMALAREHALREKLTQVRAEYSSMKEATRIKEDVWVKKREELYVIVNELELKVDHLEEELKKRKEVAVKEDEDDDLLYGMDDTPFARQRDMEQRDDEEADDDCDDACKKSVHVFLLEAVGRIQDSQANQATVASTLLALDDLALKYECLASSDSGIDDGESEVSDFSQRVLLGAVTRGMVIDTDAKDKFDDRWQPLFHAYLEQSNEDEQRQRQEVVISELEHACCELGKVGVARFSSLVVCLYKGDVLDADTVEKWYLRETKIIHLPRVDVCDDKVLEEMRRRCAPFVRWLSEEDEESEESESEQEEEESEEESEDSGNESDHEDMSDDSDDSDHPANHSRVRFSELESVVEYTEEEEEEDTGYRDA